jgi:predicted outer membrane repeat protein
VDAEVLSGPYEKAGRSMKKEGRREEMNCRFLGVLAPALVWSVILWADDPPTAQRATYLPDEVIVKLRAAGTGTSSIKPLGAGPGVSSDPWARFRNRIQIRGVRQLRHAVSPLRRPRRSSAPVPHSSGKSLGKATAPDLDNIYRLKVTLPPNQSLDDIIALLQADAAVEYAERNQRVFLHTAPNDPYYPQQWALRNTGQAFPIPGGGERTGTAGADIGAEQAWDVVTNAAEVVVAVVDTGVDYTHRDLVNRMWINTAEAQGRPGVDDDGNGYIDDVYGYNCEDDTGDPLDDNGHGTLCAGIIAAQANNGMDIAGICPSARIMAVRNLNLFGGGGDSFTSAEAIYYAVANGADVISCSWGSESYSETERRAVDFARRQGVLVIASAGNAGSDRLQYPASCEAVISVAATDANDRRTEWSTYGDWVDIAAPGTMILSLRAAHTDLYTDHEEYVPGDRFVPFSDPNATLYLASGTSMAAPMVAGVAALVIAQRPDASLDEIRDRLLMAADDLSDLNPEYMGLLGSGRVNAFRAVSPTFRGLLTLDRPFYHGQDQVQIQLIDFDLAPGVSTELDAFTDQGDRERVLLTRNPERPWLFAGTIRTGTEVLLRGDGILQVEHNESLTARYADQADEQGQALEISASAVTDIVSPHDDNDGNYYRLNTEMAQDVHVPGQYPTIQEGIDSCWPGHTVWVADGIYTGTGNRDIDLRGKAIAVRSENGPENCILDCQGSETEPHRGFLFQNHEGPATILSGFTITNGCTARDDTQTGGAILCQSAGPLLENCIFQGNRSYTDGGAIACSESTLQVNRCVFLGNRADRNGGALYAAGKQLHLHDCSFIANVTGEDGGVFMDLRTALLTNGPNPIRDIQRRDPNRFHISYCDIQTGALGEGNIDADPLFVASNSSDPLAWDLHLQPASPYIDTGVLFPMAGDYGELPLPLDGNADGVARSDMGAYEFQPLDEAPVIGVNVPHMDFVAYQGAENPADQILQIHNAGAGVLHWRLELDPACPWLRVAQVLGQAPAAQMDSISVGVDSEDIVPGDYRCDLTIVSDSARNSPLAIPIQLHLSAPPGRTRARAVQHDPGSPRCRGTGRTCCSVPWTLL